VIDIVNVSKKFRIWEDRSRDLKETAINFLRGKKRSFRDLWALREIDLKIKEGETVAFIGENGSGKSTLLKLLGGIYMPDEGKIVTQGKISSLLELGVGFHPDLTGEENIYLNGAMLGFDRKEMREKFDGIVSFSEIGDFIYSPIRTYSSGMLMRLGFSVAMCVDPDILLIDEVLAVGDEAFQNKCLERLETFKTSGKTIILVSHSLWMVQRFCERVILLHGGRVVCDDIPEKTIEAYHVALYGYESSTPLKDGVESHEIEGEDNPPAETSSGDKEESREKREAIQENPPENIPGGGMETVAPKPPCYQRFGTFEAEITEVLIKSSEQGKETDSFISGEMISIDLHIRFHRDIENPNVGMSILEQKNGQMIIVYSTNTLRKNMNLGFLRGNTDIEVEFTQRLSLPEGEYYLTVAITNSHDSGWYDWHENLKTFQIRKAGSHWEGIVDLDSQIIIRQ
jgi:ABC-type polysaccharide/polyol phosphate transport system ATPase subunit